MGMYTELNIGIELKRETPSEVIAALKHMALGDAYPVVKLDHPFFETDRWTWALRSGGSYYFDAKPYIRFEYDNISSSWFLTVCTNIKNYRGEWEKMLDWLGPWISTDGYIGTYRYEEAERPTLLFAENDKVRFEAARPRGADAAQALFNIFKDPRCKLTYEQRNAAEHALRGAGVIP